MSTTPTETAGVADVYLEREGERRMRQVVETVQRVPWSVTFAELAWTAGPVTFLAAQGGYWFGYGKLLPGETLAFFVVYTALAGVIGQGVRIFYRALLGRRQQERHSALSTAIDVLPELVFAVRDLSLEPLAPEARRREAAWLLLRKGDPGPYAASIAVEDLTGSNRLAWTVARMEGLRRAGLHRRVRDLLEEDASQIRLVLDELRETVPAMAATLRARLYQGPPTLKQGVAREEDFVERVLAAIGDDNESLMTLADVEEMLTLAFELINGRVIPMLVFDYRGRWELARATDALEAARADDRIVRVLGYNRLRALVAYLVEQAADPELAEGAGNRRQADLLATVHRVLTRLSRNLRALGAQVRQGRQEALDALAERTAVLSTALELYRKMQDAYRLQHRRSAALTRAAEHWEAVAARSPEPLTTLRTGKGEAGLRMREQSIRLEDEQKLAVAGALAESLRKAERDQRRGRLTGDQLKQLAVEVALALEPYIHLSRPAIQRAINSANAPFFGALEPGLSAARKAALGAAIAGEVEKDMGRAAERLAASLVRHYRLRLTGPVIDWLHRTYGARRETLHALAEYTVPGDRAPFDITRRRPLNIPPPRRRWHQDLEDAQALLARHGREPMAAFSPEERHRDDSAGADGAIRQETGR